MVRCRVHLTPSRHSASNSAQVWRKERRSPPDRRSARTKLKRTQACGCVEGFGSTNASWSAPQQACGVTIYSATLSGVVVLRLICRASAVATAMRPGFAVAIAAPAAGHESSTLATTSALRLASSEKLAIAVSLARHDEGSRAGSL